MKYNFYTMTQTQATLILRATWICPKCKDWYHMPHKFCKCYKKS